MQYNQGRQKGKVNRGYKSQPYVYGNAARELDPVRELQKPIEKQNVAVRKNRDRMKYMNLSYVIFLCAATAIAGIMLIVYLQKQSEMTITMERIAALESQVNDIRLRNDEQLQHINSAIDMDEIKRIAVEELGMTYAKEGQVVSISNEGSDYVRQLKSLPKE